MALDLIVDNLDAVPEATRSLYVAYGDKFKLDVSGIEDTSGLKSALDKERKTARELEKQSNIWKSLGKTPEEIQALVEAQAQAETDKLAKNGEWDKLRAQMNDKHAQELAEVNGKVTAKDQALSKYLVDAAATSAIAAAKGVPELLLPHVRSSVKVIEENGEYLVRVVDAAGNPRVNAKGEFLSINDLVGEMRGSTVFGRAFESSGASGGGASSSAGAGQKQMTKAQFLALSPVARANAMAGGTVLTD
jgi:hypothetical protein